MNALCGALVWIIASLFPHATVLLRFGLASTKFKIPVLNAKSCSGFLIGQFFRDALTLKGHSYVRNIFYSTNLYYANSNLIMQTFVVSVYKPSQCNQALLTDLRRSKMSTLTLSKVYKKLFKVLNGTTQLMLLFTLYSPIPTQHDQGMKLAPGWSMERNKTIILLNKTPPHSFLPVLP